METAWMVLVPVAALVALALVAPGAERPSVRAAALTALAVFLVLPALRTAFPDEMIWPNTEVARRTRWLVRHLESKPDWEGSPVVMLAGSSATLFGIDPVLVEKSLASAGHPATVLTFCMAGETLYERRYMLQSFLRQLGPDGRRKLAQADVTFFSEVFDAYDRNPLYRLEKEALTERAILFLNPVNAWKAWTAYQAQAEDEPALPRGSVDSLLAQHAVMNAFAVGAFAEMTPPWTKRRRTPPFHALQGRKEGFDADRALRIWRERSGGADHEVPYRQWQTAHGHLLEPLEPYLDRTAFYCLPTIEPSRAAYAEAFTRWARPQFAVLGPPSEAEMSRLTEADLWFDGVHPTGRGAELFSGWFAEQLLQSGILSENQAAPAM